MFLTFSKACSVFSEAVPKTSGLQSVHEWIFEIVSQIGLSFANQKLSKNLGSPITTFIAWPCWLRDLLQVPLNRQHAPSLIKKWSISTNFRDRLRCYYLSGTEGSSEFSVRTKLKADWVKEAGPAKSWEFNVFETNSYTDVQEGKQHILSHAESSSLLHHPESSNSLKRYRSIIMLILRASDWWH